MQTKSENTNNRLAMIKRWQESSQSINVFCKEENISYHMFMYWRNKLVRQKKPSRFIKLKSSEVFTTKFAACEIIFTNGNRVNFHSHPEAVYLRQLIA